MAAGDILLADRAEPRVFTEPPDPYGSEGSLLTATDPVSSDAKTGVRLSEEDHEITERCLRCVTEEDLLTVQLRQSTAYIRCAAELKLAGGKTPSLGVRPQDLGPTGSTHTTCQSNPCLPRSCKEHTRREKRHADVKSIIS